MAKNFYDVEYDYFDTDDDSLKGELSDLTNRYLEELKAPNANRSQVFSKYAAQADRLAGNRSIKPATGSYSTDIDGTMYKYYKPSLKKEIKKANGRRASYSSKLQDTLLKARDKYHTDTAISLKSTKNRQEAEELLRQRNETAVITAAALEQARKDPALARELDKLEQAGVDLSDIFILTPDSYSQFSTNFWAATPEQAQAQQTAMSAPPAQRTTGQAPNPQHVRSSTPERAMEQNVSAQERLGGTQEESIEKAINISDLWDRYLDTKDEGNVPDWFTRTLNRVLPYKETDSKEERKAKKFRRGYLIFQHISSILGNAANGIANSFDGGNRSTNTTSYINQYRDSQMAQMLENRKQKQQTLLDKQRELLTAAFGDDVKVIELEGRLRNTGIWAEFNRLSQDQQLILKAMLLSDNRNLVSDATLGAIVQNMTEDGTIDPKQAITAAAMAGAIESGAVESLSSLVEQGASVLDSVIDRLGAAANGVRERSSAARRNRFE